MDEMPPPATVFLGRRVLQLRAEPRFTAVLEAYQQSGGLALAEEILALLDAKFSPDIARLARWIVERQVISFYWNADTWIPLFQFNRLDMSVRPELAPVLAELNPVYDRWDLAMWFARPNAALVNRSPVQVFSTDPVEVLHAARLDRFVANG